MADAHWQLVRGGNPRRQQWVPGFYAGEITPARPPHQQEEIYSEIMTTGQQPTIPPQFLQGPSDTSIPFPVASAPYEQSATAQQPGYIYGNYLWPPTQPSGQIVPPNIEAVVAPSSYYGSSQTTTPLNSPLSASDSFNSLGLSSPLSYDITRAFPDSESPGPAPTEAHPRAATRNDTKSTKPAPTRHNVSKVTKPAPRRRNVTKPAPRTRSKAHAVNVLWDETGIFEAMLANFDIKHPETLVNPSSAKRMGCKTTPLHTPRMIGGLRAVSECSLSIRCTNKQGHIENTETKAYVLDSDCAEFEDLRIGEDFWNNTRKASPAQGLVTRASMTPVESSSQASAAFNTPQGSQYQQFPPSLAPNSGFPYQSPQSSNTIAPNQIFYESAFGFPTSSTDHLGPTNNPDPWV